MTSNPLPDRDPSSDFLGHASFLAGRWIRHDEMCVSVHDAGFRQGVTVVERLRTYQGNVFALDTHLDRWEHSVAALAIEGLPVRQRLAELVEELLAKNAALVRAQSDVGITMFATPGTGSGQAATLGMHLNRLDHAGNRRRCESGQPLVVTQVKQPDSDCWPRSVKVRCRLHYYLADRIARQRDEAAIGVLIDHDGTVTETSIANLAIVDAGRIISPSAEQVLGGITQGIVEQLAAAASIAWTKSRLSAAQFMAADEILLMGTDTGLWFANVVDAEPIRAGQPGPIVRELQRRFQQLTEPAAPH